jgi:hypothetical protein
LERAPAEVSAPPPAEEGTTAGPTASPATATAAAVSAAPLAAALGAATLAATAAAATVAGLGADALGAVEMSGIDLERALNDPAGLFENPDAVVHHPALTREQKIRILNNWQLDASRLEGSEGEGMMGEGAPMLHRVRVALAALTGQR